MGLMKPLVPGMMMNRGKLCINERDGIMSDILFKTDDYVFSYRVAGILIHDGKVLLQKTSDDTGYAFPGGHVEFGETNEESLIREFKEETGTDIKVKEIKWVAEIFFPWGDKPCHQICIYYLIELADETQLPLDGKFMAHEHIEGRGFDIEFHWIPLEKVKNIEVYLRNAGKLLEHIHEGVKHFVYREN
jgi:8-oxo-dGTP pyrophosphatase MutT (NUDIX family)